MENAAKALIIAATTILGILLLSIMVYMFRVGASVDEQYDQNQSSLQLELYNSQFEVYNTQYNSIMDLITVCNLAYSRNAETDYDSRRAVSINIKVGSKNFQIPSDKSVADSVGLKKNQILLNGSVISIYNLADTPLKDLGILGVGNSEDKLSKSYTGTVKYKKNKYSERIWECSKCGRISMGIDAPSECSKCKNPNLYAKELINAATVYKYIFNCSKVEYDKSNGRVVSMEFELNKVTDSDSILYWDSSKYE